MLLNSPGARCSRDPLIAALFVLWYYSRYLLERGDARDLGGLVPITNNTLLPPDGQGPPKRPLHRILEASPRYRACTVACLPGRRSSISGTSRWAPAARVHSMSPRILRCARENRLDEPSSPPTWLPRHDTHASTRHPPQRIPPHGSHTCTHAFQATPLNSGPQMVITGVAALTGDGQWTVNEPTAGGQNPARSEPVVAVTPQTLAPIRVAPPGPFWP